MIYIHEAKYTNRYTHNVNATYVTTNSAALFTKLNGTCASHTIRATHFADKIDDDASEQRSSGRLHSINIGVQIATKYVLRSSR